MVNSTDAREIFVDNITGDDRNDGSSGKIRTSGIGPVRSISRAIRMARNGDQIVVAKTAVPYRESLTLQGKNQSGTENLPFVIRGNGATLDGSMEIPPLAWKHQANNVFRYRPKLMSFQTLYINGLPARRIRVANNLELDDLAPNCFAVKNGYIYFCVEEGKVPDDYSLSCSGMVTGLTLYSCRNVIVQDLVIQGFQIDGVNAKDNVTNSSVVGVTSRGNGRSGISVEGASRLRIEACLIGSNSTAQIRTDGFSKTEIVGCDLIEEDTAAPAILVKGGRVWKDSKQVLPLK